MGANPYKDITDRIVAMLERGDNALAALWRGGGLPANVASGNEYRGVNVLALWLAADRRDFETPLWGTFRQWRDKGASVRRGERGTPIVFYRTVDSKTAVGRDGAPVRFPVARWSRVFNIAQVDGHEAAVPIETGGAGRVAAAEALIAATGARVVHGGATACYIPAADEIRMPPIAAFRDGVDLTATEAYYCVYLHEIAHWTGHPSRLNRDLSGRFGSRAYAAEELVAELTAVFVCGALGLCPRPREDHAAYIAHWIALLKDDDKAIFKASSLASRAADHIRAFGAADDPANRAPGVATGEREGLAGARAVRNG